MNQATTLRNRLYQLLEPVAGGPPLARLVTIFIVVLVLLNVTTNILASMQEFYVEHKGWLFKFELVSTLIFTVEYFARLWTCVESKDGRFRAFIKGRLRFALTPMMLIDLLAILPFYLMLWTSLDLLFLRVFRLFRVFKLTRYSPAMGMLITVLRRESRSFGAAMFILLVIMTFAASGIYLVEHESQPESFGSIPAAMWWAVATLTTVGYGDVTPMTPLGKLFGASITIVGVGMVALPAGILASAFSDELRKRREEFKLQVDKVYEDGVLDSNERTALESQRRSLGIEKDEARQMLDTARDNVRDSVDAGPVCPHCGGRLP
jgi:voltage-gated potassium channel